MKKNILFISSIKTHFLEFKRYFNYSYSDVSNNFRFIILFNFYYEDVNEDIEFCKINKIIYLSTFKHIYKIIDNGNQQELQHKSNNLYTLLRMCKWLFLNIKNIIQTKKLFHNYKINLLVVCEDNISYGLNIYTKVANKLNINTIIFPFTLPNPIEFLEQIKSIHFYKYDNKNILHRLLKFKYSNWLLNYNSITYLRAPIWQILALEILNYAPKTPWISNNEEKMTVAVESEFMMKYYLNYGINKSNLILTGSLIDDRMYEILLSKVKNRSKFKLNILCAFPPPQLHHNSKYSSYRELVIELLESFKPLASEHDVVFKMHPRVDIETIEFIKKSGYNVVATETFELIAQCDIYVAFISATIRWAINLNIPIINFDIYNYNYNDFENLHNVKNISNIIDFRNELYKLIEACNYDSNRSLNNIYLDGSSSFRINNLIQTTIN
jgi:hypothetical protein